jgi:hypothetical protein
MLQPCTHVQPLQLAADLAATSKGLRVMSTNSRCTRLMNWRSAPVGYLLPRSGWMSVMDAPGGRGRQWEQGGAEAVHAGNQRGAHNRQRLKLADRCVAPKCCSSHIHELQSLHLKLKHCCA